MKMMNRLIYLITLCALCTAANAQLSQSWITEAKLEVPESVKYYEEGQCIFVSNIVGSPANKDGVGFISKLSLKGEVIHLKWIEGLDAPKGMAINDGVLYVSNINELVIIDIEQAKIVKRIPHVEASFLNDVTITHNNEVLVSDSGNACIYVLKDSKLEVWLQSEAIKGVNGLFAEEDYVLVGTNNRILKVEVASKTHEVFVETTGQVDGIESDGKGGYYYSYWEGEMYYFKPSHDPVKLLDTQADNIQSADIAYNPHTGEVLVPTFFANQVVAYIKD